MKASMYVPCPWDRWGDPAPLGPVDEDEDVWSCDDHEGDCKDKDDCISMWQSYIVDEEHEIQRLEDEVDDHQANVDEAHRRIKALRDEPKAVVVHGKTYTAADLQTAWL